MTLQWRSNGSFAWISWTRGIQTNEELQQMMFTVVFHNCDQAELNWKMFFLFLHALLMCGSGI